MNPHIYNPHGDDVIELTAQQPESPKDAVSEAAEAYMKKLDNEKRLEFYLAIARDAAEQWKRHLAGLIALWDALGVYGFICRDQAKVPEYLAKLAELRAILRG